MLPLTLQFLFLTFSTIDMLAPNRQLVRYLLPFCRIFGYGFDGFLFFVECRFNFASFGYLLVVD